MDNFILLNQKTFLPPCIMTSDETINLAVVELRSSNEQLSGVSEGL